MYSKARSATASGRGVPIRMESHRRGARFVSSRSIRFISRSICWRSQAVEGEISRENMTGRGGHSHPLSGWGEKLGFPVPPPDMGGNFLFVPLQKGADPHPPLLCPKE